MASYDFANVFLVAKLYKFYFYSGRFSIGRLRIVVVLVGIRWAPTIVLPLNVSTATSHNYEFAVST